MLSRLRRFDSAIPVFRLIKLGWNSWNGGDGTSFEPLQRLGCNSEAVGCHTWRATGITIYLENDGRLEHVQQMAGHKSPRTTKLYDRTKDEITLTEAEPPLQCRDDRARRN